MLLWKVSDDQGRETLPEGGESMSADQTGKQYEEGLDGSTETVAEFEDTRKGLIGKLQRREINR